MVHSSLLFTGWTRNESWNKRKCDGRDKRISEEL